MQRVMITDFWTTEPDVERAALDGVATVETLGAETEEALDGRIAAADALLVWHDIRIGPRSLRQLERCKVLVRVGVGFDNVDLEAAAEAGVPVCNVPDYGVEEVADHALAMLLALSRNLLAWNRDLRAAPPRWQPLAWPRTPRLRGRVLGIVGLGRIGTAMAVRAKALGLRVKFYDPYLADGRDKALGVERVESLAELLEQSFVLSLHTPLTDETRGMLDAAAVARLPEGALVINTARGPICDTAALLAGLEEGRLGGVGLDVLPGEPADDDDPLVRAARDPGSVAHQRCLLTPHAAFYSEAGFEEMRAKAAREARRALLGEPLRNRVR